MKPLLLLVLLAARAHAGDAFGSSNDPRHSINVVMVAEGWQAGEEGAFENACKTLTSALFSPKCAPFDKYGQMFRFTTLFVASKDHGCRRLWSDKSLYLLHPENDPARHKETYFGVSYSPRDPQNPDSCPPDASMNVGAAAKAKVAEKVAALPHDCVMLITPDDDLTCGVRFPEETIAKMGLIAMTTYDIKNKPGDIASVLCHELGHAAFNLADEYSGGGDCAVPASEPDAANATISRTNPKWQDLIDSNLVGPPQQGGMYCSDQVWHPTAKCRMLDQYKYDTFCVVCLTRMTHGMSERSSIIQSSEPGGLIVVGDSITRFTFRAKTRAIEDTPDCERFDAFWEVDGRVQYGKRIKDPTGDIFELTIGIPNGFNPGSHKVRFNIGDHIQGCFYPNARKDGTISNTREWWLDIRPISSRIPSLTGDGGWE